MELQVVGKESRSLQIRAFKQEMLTDEDLDQIKDFTQELDQALTEIGEATRKSQALSEDVRDLKSNLDKRGWFGSAWASLSGKTDKELALMVESLGAGLTVTQNVVRVILKVMTQKNRVLHGFNKALVDKITAVTKDTVTLDKNQRLVAQEFLGSLQRQVAEQIRQMEMVDEHEMKLIEFDGWRAEKEEKEAGLGRGLEDLGDSVDAFRAQVEAEKSAVQATLTGLESSMSSLRREADERQAAVSQSLNELTEGLTSHGEKLVAHTRWMEAKQISDLQAITRVGKLEACSDALTAEDARQDARISEQAESLMEKAAEIQALQASERALQQQVESLQGRIAKLEDLEGQSHGIKARLLRYGPSVVAGGLASAALYQAMI